MIGIVMVVVGCSAGQGDTTDDPADVGWRLIWRQEVATCAAGTGQQTVRFPIPEQLIAVAQVWHYEHPPGRDGYEDLDSMRPDTSLNWGDGTDALVVACTPSETEDVDVVLTWAYWGEGEDPAEVPMVWHHDTRSCSGEDASDGFVDWPRPDERMAFVMTSAWDADPSAAGEVVDQSAGDLVWGDPTLSFGCDTSDAYDSVVSVVWAAPENEARTEGNGRPVWTEDTNPCEDDGFAYWTMPEEPVVAAFRAGRDYVPSTGEILAQSSVALTGDDYYTRVVVGESIRLGGGGCAPRDDWASTWDVTFATWDE